jgi:hypothetical protein
VDEIRADLQHTAPWWPQGVNYEDLPPALKSAVDEAVEAEAFIGRENLENAGEMSFNKIKGLTTELNYRINSGEVSGNIKGAMKQVAAALGTLKANIAAAHGATEEYDAANGATQDFQEAFGRERKPRGTVGENRKGDVNPEAHRAEVKAKRMAAIKRLNPALAEHATRVQQLGEKTKQFADPEGLRKGMPQAPKPPDEVLPGKPQKLPSDPKLHGPQGMPGNLKDPHVPTPELPLKPDTEVPDISKEVHEKLRKGLRRYGFWGSWVLRLVVGGATGQILHGEGAGALASNLFMGQVAVTLLTDSIHESEGALRWMEKPTIDSVRMLDRISPEDAAKLREAWTGMAVEDAKAGRGGGKIAPEIAKFLGPTNLQLITAAVTAGHPQNAGEAKRRAHAMRLSAIERTP